MTDSTIATSAPTTLTAEPLTLPCGVTIKNRFYKSAMNEALAGRDCAPTEAHVRLYRTWAQGGAGVLVTGNVMVDHMQLGEPGNVVVEDERDLAMLRRWAAAGTENGAHCWMQINHPGRQSPITINPHPVAPSAGKVAGEYGKFFAEPTELTREQIHDIIRRFANTARIAKKAGFTGVEIHAAHGYLINQFLSPLDNRRTDEYGGSLENRARFLFDVFDAVRKTVGPKFPIAVKLNSSDVPIAIKVNERDGAPGGFSEEESVWVMKQLEARGVDLIDISGGTYSKPVIQTNDGAAEDRRRGVYFTDFARRIKGELSVPIALTGGFRNADDMERALDEGITQMIGIARPLALVPDLPNRIIRDGWRGSVDLPRVTTGIKHLDKAFGGILVISWFELQIHRIARGKHPNPRIGGMRALLFSLKQHGPAALTPRRRKGRQ
ncbi:NADH:flavin oxidoreductase/NADH oxidase family protein [Bifidobacterium imperatoris]|uniref:NADH:flavin oxidoreductase n=1 Tax=Bifidobacterium imperatoris TaxID=2020965 RepID=A0A2N5IPC9_9BIFI|nr:NADH:flavin oxidoreductase/NADH oxidase family protein [Bifidobacterium imperatoris]PLS23827.1 NADH:flavin oxidoreductase [Bifidobacterium imperatoris]QSY57389.1 NADH:flavin oxidoreductase/NADH oxidase family protein [Bifidobacterium imperatoris]